MTEQEFMRQVWRPYDTVEIDGGMKGRVTSVCFPTRSCKVTISQEVHEWFKCDMIVSHTSAAGATEDAAIIKELHNKLMAANERNQALQDIVNEQKEKLKDPNKAELNKLRQAVNKATDALNSCNSRIKKVDDYLTNLGVTEGGE